MNLLDKFRLTKMLHDQVEVSGDDISGVLGSWEEQDYKGLCEYVTQCQNVVPKYVARLAKLTGMDPREVVFEIVGAQGAGQEPPGRAERRAAEHGLHAEAPSVQISTCAAS
jgi:hypothetical protein